MSAWWPTSKMLYKNVFIFANKVVGLMTYSAAADMSTWLIFIVMCMIVCPVFLTIHPDLVLMTSYLMDLFFCLLECLQFLVYNCYL